MSFFSHLSSQSWSQTHLSIGSCCRTTQEYSIFIKKIFFGKIPVFEPYLQFTSAFTVVESSLDCWLRHWFAHVLENVLDLANCWGFFWTRERNLLSSTTVTICGLLSLLLFLSPSVHNVFKNMPKRSVGHTGFPFSLVGLFWYFSLIMACFTGFNGSLNFILRVNSNRFQMKM